MKSLFVTLLIIGTLFLGYDYYMAPPGERIIFERPAPEKRVQTEGTPASENGGRPHQDQTSQNPPKLPAAKAPASEIPIAAAPPGSNAAATANTAFIPPRFDSIEVLTDSWKRIPPTAFPRTVKLLKDTTFKFAVGSSVVRAGAGVVALKMDNGQLIIAPNEASPARQAVPLENTDLKAILVQLYEKWKVDRITEARRNHEERLRQPKPVVEAAAPAVDATGKPEAAPDGKYPILIAQLQKGIPSEITPANITRWKEPVLGTYRGNPTWTIEVSYKTKTLFGEMDVDSLAHVQHGRVVDWVFKGSGEPVP